MIQARKCHSDARMQADKFRSIKLARAIVTVPQLCVWYRNELGAVSFCTGSGHTDGVRLPLPIPGTQARQQFYRVRPRRFHLSPSFFLERCLHHYPSSVSQTRILTLFPVIENTAAFDAIAEEWNEVAESLHPGSPFAHHSWFRDAWLTCYKDKSASLKVIRVSNGSRHYGFLPLIIESGPLRSLRSRQLKLMLPTGHSTPVRIPLNFAAISEDQDLSRELVATIESLDWDELILDGLEAGDSEKANLLLTGMRCTRAGAGTTFNTSAQCPVISLTDTWENFQSQLTANKRKELRRNEQRLSRLGEVSFIVISDPEAIAREFAESIRRAQLRYKQVGFTNGFDDDAFTKFHMNSSVGLAARDQVRLFQLKSNQETIASLYVFKERGTYHAYQGGFDERFGKYGPGTLLDAMAMRYGLEKDGIKFFDFGYGAQAYKTRFPHELRPVATLRVRRPSWARLSSETSVTPTGHSPEDSVERGKKTLILSIGHVAGVALGMLTPMILSRRFEVDDFGIYRQFLVIVWFIGLTAQFGMDSGLFYFVRKHPEKSSVFSLNTATFNAFVASLVGVGLIGFAGPLADLLESQPLAQEMPYVALYFLFALPGQHLPFYLLVRNQIRTATLFAIANATANAVAAIIGCLVFGSVRAVIIGLTIWAAAKLIWMVWLHGRREVFSYLRNWLPDLRLMKQQIRFGAPIGMATIVTVAARLDRFLVSAFFGLRVFTGYSVGCFDLPVLPNVFDSMSGLMVTDMVKRGESASIDRTKRERVTAIWLSTISQILILLVPAVIFSVIFAETMIVAFFSEKYRASAAFFQIYMLSFFLLYLDPDHVFQGLARTKLSFKINFAGAVLSLSAMYIGMQQFGVAGILIGRVAGEAIATTTRFFVLGHLLKINTARLIPWKEFILLFLASALAAKATQSAIELVEPTGAFLRLLIAAAVFGTAYAMLGMLFGVLKIQTVIALVRKQRVDGVMTEAPTES